MFSAKSLPLVATQSTLWNRCLIIEVAMGCCTEIVSVHVLTIEHAQYTLHKVIRYWGAKASCRMPKWWSAKSARVGPPKLLYCPCSLLFSTPHCLHATTSLGNLQVNSMELKES